jgi:hypothetical protein
LIDHEAKLLVEEQYQRAKQILIENKDHLVQLSELLLEKEVIFSEDVERIFGKRKFIEEEIPKLKVLKPEIEKKEEEVKDENIELSVTGDEKLTE